MRIAITGGTGSLGSSLIALLATRPYRSMKVERVVAISRDEVKSGALAERFSAFTALRCVLADVRDRERLEQAFWGCDVVVHAAALKQVTQSVYSPSELIKTNVHGTVNVIAAAMAAGVARVLFVSSDKCVESINLYGMTKAVAECYAVQSNSYAYPRGTRVACVRYGNVLGSRGSVVEVWREQLRRGEPLRVTDLSMTRFIITLPQAVAFVLAAVADMEGGEIFVPVLPAARLSDLADAVERAWIRSLVHDQDVDRRVITGLRPGGEKRHEALLSHEEPSRAWVVGARPAVLEALAEDPDSCHLIAPLLSGGINDRVTILPSHHSWRAEWPIPPGARRMSSAYTSDDPIRWLGVEELVEMLKEAP